MTLPAQSMTLRQFAISYRNLEGCVAFARRPWTPDSEINLIKAAVDDVRRQDGFEYVIEADVADEVFGSSLDDCDADTKAAAIIYYADNDAFPDWLNIVAREG